MRAYPCDLAESEALDSITATIPMRRFGPVEEIAGIAAVLVSPVASYLTDTLGALVTEMKESGFTDSIL